MARQRVKSEPALHSWQEVDGALRQIAECQNLIDEKEIEMNRQINEIKDNTEMMTRPMREKVKVLEQHIKQFVDDHRPELGGEEQAADVWQGRLSAFQQAYDPARRRRAAQAARAGAFRLHRRQRVDQQGGRQAAAHRADFAGRRLRQANR